MQNLTNETFVPDTSRSIADQEFENVVAGVLLGFSAVFCLLNVCMCCVRFVRRFRRQIAAARFAEIMRFDTTIFEEEDRETELREPERVAAGDDEEQDAPCESCPRAAMTAPSNAAHTSSAHSTKSV